MKKAPEPTKVQGAFNDTAMHSPIDQFTVKASVANKSTDGEAQRQRIVEALRRRPQTSYDLRRAGCYQCPTRVFELRQRGYDIATSRVVVIDADGFEHRQIALYELIAEPEGGGA